MLSLVVIASLVLPTVLGGCCYPVRMASTIFRAGQLNHYDYLVDFSMKKYVAIPSRGDVRHILGDLNSGRRYTFFNNGKCSSTKDTRIISQCISEKASQGPDFKLGDATVRPYILTEGTTRKTYVVTPEECKPLMLITTHGDSTVTEIFTNISTSAVNDVSSLSMDTSGCQVSEVVG